MRGSHNAAMKRGFVEEYSPRKPTHVYPRRVGQLYHILRSYVDYVDISIDRVSGRSVRSLVGIIVDTREGCP